jgi:hypothetical protein
MLHRSTRKLAGFLACVPDTQTDRVKVYFNPLNQTAAPVQDVDAFATCP